MLENGQWISPQCLGYPLRQWEQKLIRTGSGNFSALNSTSLLQPMDQGVISTLKTYDLCRTFSLLNWKTDGENRPTIGDFWYVNNIMKATDNIRKSSFLNLFKLKTQFLVLNIFVRKSWPEMSPRNITSFHIIRSMLKLNLLDLISLKVGLFRNAGTTCIPMSTQP